MAGQITEGRTKSAHSSSRSSPIGNFTIHSLKIKSPLRRASQSGSVLDLSDISSPGAWTEINFYEAIESPVVSGDITILDTTGFVEGLPMLGEETLEVMFSTSDATPRPINPESTNIDPSTQEKIIKSEFRIFKIDPPIKSTDASRTITLRFVSDLHIKNIQTLVQKSYNATSFLPLTVADIARKIYFESFVNTTTRQNSGYQGTKKEFLVEPTSGLYSVHIPNWNPFTAIQFLAKKAISSNKKSSGANFMFYETLKGFRFVSMETLMQGGFNSNNFDQLTSGEEVTTKFPEYAAHVSRTDQPFIPVYSERNTEDADVTPNFVATYTYRPANIDEDEYTERFGMTNFRLKKSVDVLKNTKNGMYSNRVISHDLISMEVYRRDYLYKEQKPIIRTEVGGVSVTANNKNLIAEDLEVDINDFSTAENGALCSEYADYTDRPETYVSLVPSNRAIGQKYGSGPRKSLWRNNDLESDNYGTVSFAGDLGTRTPDGRPDTAFPIDTDRNVEKILAKRISQLSQYNTIQVEFTAPGDSAREVGDLIYISYPSEKSEIHDTGNFREHKYYSGKYLVTALRHKITQKEYEIIVEASKDSYLSEPSSGFEANAPRTQTPDGTDYVEEGR